jgi:hypothetical protein
MIKPARSIFCPPAFSDEEVERIFAAAAGQTLSFPAATRSLDPSISRSLTPALLAYARGENWSAALTVSRRRFYQVLAAERKNCCPERVLTFQREGLSLRQLAVLYDRSVPTIQRVLDESISDPPVSGPRSPVNPKEA